MNVSFAKNCHPIPKGGSFVPRGKCSRRPTWRRSQRCWNSSVAVATASSTATAKGPWNTWTFTKRAIRHRQSRRFRRNRRARPSFSPHSSASTTAGTHRRSWKRRSDHASFFWIRTRWASCSFHISHVSTTRRIWASSVAVTSA